MPLTCALLTERKASSQAGSKVPECRPGVAQPVNDYYYYYYYYY